MWSIFTDLRPGREVHLLDHPGYAGKVPERLSRLPPTREFTWIMLVWNGHPEEAYAFVVRVDHASPPNTMPADTVFPGGSPLSP